MTQLPAAIEQYLLECGFTSTEILILKHLLAGGSMTLRELAAKTGKSTGVLDSASKKLLKKGILGKELVNDSPKLTLSSLEAVVAWVHEDSERTRTFMERREKDLQSFVDSLTPNMSRADIEHFEKMDGLERAYTKLLEGCNGVMLHFLPVRHTEVEDPLRDFLVQFFRVRRRQGIITRVIAHDTPLGRRYQSRDPFEYRQTLLVPESVYAFNTEKVIAGDWVGTINHADAKALIIRSPEMAHTERAMFEAIWKQEMAKQKEKGDAGVPVVVPKEEEMKTKMVSAAREFFLSRKTLLSFAVCCVLAASVTYALYLRNVDLNVARISEQVKGIAATGAVQFDTTDLDKLHTKDDAQKPEYEKVILQLRKIREQNDRITYAYIMRPTSNKAFFEFVADADSLNLDAKIDLNKDGIIDDADWLSPPGELYDVSGLEDRVIEALSNSVAFEPYTDQWGTFISGWAPIKDSEGKTIAILGIDRHADDVYLLTLEDFTPFYYFFGFFTLFLIIRFAAFNRSLLKEVLQVFQFRKVLIVCAFCAEIAFGITLIFYLHTLSLLKEQIGQHLMSIAVTTAAEINSEDLEKLHWAKDMHTATYQKVFNQLNSVRDGNKNMDIRYVYTYRLIAEPDVFEFIVDADSNYNLPSWVDFNGDGIRDPDEENVWPGKQYVDPVPSQPFRHSLQYPLYDEDYAIDQWGTLLGSYAPIKDKEGKSVAAIGISIDVSDILKLTREQFSVWLWFSGIFALLITVVLIARPK